MADKRKRKPVPTPKSRREWIYYPDWVVAQSEIAVEEASAGIAAIDYCGRHRRDGWRPVRREFSRECGGSFAAAARAQREAQAAVERSDRIVARASGSVYDRFGPRR